MNAILSVNCVYICALQRLFGDHIFAHIGRDLYVQFKENHLSISNPEKQNDSENTLNNSKTKVKNILNCFLHFFIFKSMNGQLLFDLIKVLLTSYTESDIEVLIFILHNIGLQLRKEDPGAVKEIIDMAESKKNSYAVELKMAEAAEKSGESGSGKAESGSLDLLKAKEKKTNFLALELADIKNNKGTVTL